MIEKKKFFTFNILSNYNNEVEIPYIHSINICVCVCVRVKDYVIVANYFIFLIKEIRRKKFLISTILIIGKRKCSLQFSCFYLFNN